MSPAVDDVIVTVPVGVVQVGSVCASVGVGGVGGTAPIVSVAVPELHPLAFCATIVCGPGFSPVYPPAGDAANGLPSRLNVSPAVDDVIVTVPVGVVQVGSVCASVGVGGVGGTAPIVSVAVPELHPLAFCATIVCGPGFSPVYPPAGDAADAPPSRLNVSPAVDDVIVTVPVGVVQVGSGWASVGVGGVGGTAPIVSVAVPELHPLGFCATIVRGPGFSPVYPPAGYAANAPPSRLNVSPAVDDVIVTVPVGVVQVGSVCASVGVGGVGGTAPIVSVAVPELHPLAFCATIVCGPGFSPVYPPAGYAANAPPSRLNVSPAVDDVIVTVPVGVVQVGSVCASVGVGGVGGTAPIVSVAVPELHPLAFCATIVCGPGFSPVYPPAGYAANAPPSRLNVSPAVDDVIVTVPVGVVQVGSVCASVGVGGVGGTAPIVSVAVPELHPLAFCATIVCGPGFSPAYPPAGYAANAPPSRLNVSPAVDDVIVTVPVGVVQVGSVCASVGVGGVGGTAPIVSVAVPELHPLAFCATI